MRWRTFKKTVGWALQSTWKAMAGASVVIGISGVPGDIDTWVRWIDIAMSDPTVQALAGYAVAMAEVINYPITRAGLATGGALVLIWPLRWFWRFRHRLVFTWRRALDQAVWVDEPRALDIVRTSSWATSRRPRSEKPRSIFDYASSLGMTSDPRAEERGRLYVAWCRMVLKEFTAHNSDAYRRNQDKAEYDEAALRKWLDSRYESDVLEEFGPPS